MQDKTTTAPAASEATPDVQETRKEPTTTERLFPNFGQPPASEPDNQPEPEVPASAPSTEVRTPEEQPGKEVPAPEPVEEVLDLSRLSGKKVKVKVDGEEQIVSGEQLIKNYQLEAHLTRKGQRVAEQEKAIRQLREEMMSRAEKEEKEVEDAVADGASKAELKMLREELAATKRDLAEINQVTSDIRFQRGIKALDTRVKSELGFDDFSNYVPKIQERIRSLVMDPTNPTPQEIATYDSPEFWLQTYQSMKLKELRTAPPVAQAPAPAAPPAPKLTRIVNVETAGGALPGSANDSLEAQYQAAYARMQQSGSEADQLEVFRLKRMITEKRASAV